MTCPQILWNLDRPIFALNTHCMTICVWQSYLFEIVLPFLYVDATLLIDPHMMHVPGFAMVIIQLVPFSVLHLQFQYCHAMIFLVMTVTRTITNLMACLGRGFAIRYLPACIPAIPLFLIDTIFALAIPVLVVVNYTVPNRIPMLTFGGSNSLSSLINIDYEMLDFPQ